MVARGLSKRFGAREALSGVDATLVAGEVVALAGQNGSGKSTLLRILAGLLEPDTGTVVLGGVEAGGAERRARIGYCPQSAAIWPDLTVEEQLTFVGRAHQLPPSILRERRAHLLERFALTDRARALGASLSGGMRQRLSVAMALLNDPELLLLDEPEAGLDSQSRALLRVSLAGLASDQGKAVLISTHALDEVQEIAARVILLHRGRVIAAGATAGLLAQGQVPSGGRVSLEAALSVRIEQEAR